jgi:ABC-type bacteriocin/lantibiotic exporter with double-glycine peptidase domain
LARAFYHDKDFLIFDESTSALDEESELEIYKEIMKLKGEKTIIIISHRKSALKFCDYIYDLNANVQK